MLLWSQVQRARELCYSVYQLKDSTLPYDLLEHFNEMRQMSTRRLVGNFAYEAYAMVRSSVRIVRDKIFPMPRDPQVLHDSPRHKTPVICLPGFFEAPGCFDHFSSAIKHEQLPEEVGPIFCYRYNMFWQDIEALARDVLKFLSTLPQRRFVLVGYSMGGLVAAYLNEYLAEHADIQIVSIITIASPLSGTMPASVLFKIPAISRMPALKQMSYKGEFVLALRARMEQSKCIYYSAAAGCDTVVVPHTSSVFNKTFSVVVPHVAHATILKATEVVDFFHHALTCSFQEDNALSEAIQHLKPRSKL